MIVNWESLEEGQVYWEEYILGTDTIEAKVIRKIDADHNKMHYTVRRRGDNFMSWTQVTKKSPAYRYWQDKPTLEQRETTPWE